MGDPDPIKEGRLYVIRCTQPDGQQISLLTNKKTILFCRSKPDSPWEPIGPKHKGIIAAILDKAVDIRSFIVG
jgi:hypothetical protein